MQPLELDEDGYPTEETLTAIRSWPVADADTLFARLAQLWKYTEYVWQDQDGWHFSTGGWSGHEDLIAAMRENRMLWLCYWSSSRRGGHHVFQQADAESPQQRLYAALESFRALTPDWDTYGGKPPLPGVIDAAIALVAGLPATHTWHVAPCGDGSILFESVEPDDLMIEVSDTGEVR